MKIIFKFADRSMSVKNVKDVVLSPVGDINTGLIASIRYNTQPYRYLSIYKKPESIVTKEDN